MSVQEEQHRRTHPQPMAAAFLEIDLARELDELRSEPEWKSGRNAKTLIKYEDFRVVLTALKPHVVVAEHKTEGRLSIETLRGHIELHALGRTFDMPAGKLIALDHGVVHDIVALEESALLQTIAWPSER